MGHALCMPDTHLPPHALNWIPNGGKRRRGRPKRTLRHSIADDAKDLGLQMSDLPEMAQDRPGSRSLCSALCAGFGTGS